MATSTSGLSLSDILDKGLQVFNKLADVNLSKFQLTTAAHAAQADAQARAAAAPTIPGTTNGKIGTYVFWGALGLGALIVVPKIVKAVK